MYLTKYSPNSIVDSILDDLFPTFQRWSRTEAGEEFRLPMTNVHETDSEFVLTMEMPGVDKKNINVAIENDQIVITGEKTEKVEEKSLRRREIRSEKFRRSFLLDSSVDREKIKAKLDNGVLTVTLPKGAGSVGRKVTIE
jgi:HSP20 family protein